MGENIFATTVDEYFSQWQRIPVDASIWMKPASKSNFEARSKIATFVKQHSKSILDVGCGVGWEHEYYKDSGVKYLGVDITKRFIKECKRRKIPARHGDVLNLPFKDQSFDTVYCKDLLLHLPVGLWRKALGEMVRVARKHVITLEPEWSHETVYAVKENHSCKDMRTLFFFHNVYSERGMLTFASVHELTVKKCVGKDRTRTAWTGVDTNWQITIFTKERE